MRTLRLNAPPMSAHPAPRDAFDQRRDGRIVGAGSGSEPARQGRRRSRSFDSGHRNRPPARPRKGPPASIAQSELAGLRRAFRVTLWMGTSGCHDPLIEITVDVPPRDDVTSAFARIHADRMRRTMLEHRRVALGVLIATDEPTHSPVRQSDLAPPRGVGERGVRNAVCSCDLRVDWGRRSSDCKPHHTYTDNCYYRHEPPRPSGRDPTIAR